MPGRPYILAETTWKSVRETSYEVAVLPWGATKRTNYHLPYATDTIESDHFAAESARKAWAAGAASWSCQRCRSVCRPVSLIFPFA